MPFFSVAILITIIIATYIRLHYGIDFTDESYYIVMPLRFALGDKPFVDELFINQTAALLTMPLIKAFYLWRGNTDGIVLFVRFCFFAASGLVGFIVFRYFKKYLNFSLALLIAAAQIAIIPLNIPALSYNSIGALCFTAMVFTPQSLISSLFGGLAVAAYPTLAAPCLLFQTLAVMRSPNKLKAFGSILIGFSLVAASILPFFINAGPALTDAIVYSLTSFDHGGGLAKLKLILNHVFYANIPPTLALAYLIALGAVVLPMGRSLRFLLMLSLPFLVLQAFSSAIFTQIWFVFYFSFFAPILGWNKNRQSRQLLLIAWLPSVVAGLCISWTSSSSAINGVLGLTPAFLVSLYLLIEKMRENYSNAWIPVLPALAALAILVVTQFAGKAFYRDKNFPELTTLIQGGPYQGLYTSIEKQNYLAQISADIKRVENKSGKILFYEFPAGYLISTMRPAVNSTWIRDISRGKDYYARYYARHLAPKNIVFEVDWLCHEQSHMQRVHYLPSDPLNRFIEQTHDLILARPEYRVFEPKG